tara:strand:+ start:306 stop:656 length:351 start_codon:yes stop_codon:yes gene_type:complete
MARSTNKEINARVNTLAKKLLQGHGNTACVEHAAEQWGLSRRQSYRLLERAWAQIEQDAIGSGCERRAMLAWCIDRLQVAVGNALERNNHGAAISGIRELNLLVGLGEHNRSVHRR